MASSRWARDQEKSAPTPKPCTHRAEGVRQGFQVQPPPPVEARRGRESEIRTGVPPESGDFKDLDSGSGFRHVAPLKETPTLIHVSPWMLAQGLRASSNRKPSLGEWQQGSDHSCANVILPTTSCLYLEAKRKLGRLAWQGRQGWLVRCSL